MAVKANELLLLYPQGRISKAECRGGGGGGDQVTENTFSMTPFIYNLKTDKAKETYV